MFAYFTQNFNDKGLKGKFKIFSFLLPVSILLFCPSVKAGPYLSSAHGNSTYGVQRDLTASPVYARGNCAHCHEQHASVEGAEPTPSSGSPSKYALFYSNHVSQTDNFCFKCHDNTTLVATTAITNRSYSYRAGGWTSDTLNDVLEAFNTTELNTQSTHNLDDIRTFITAQAWGYTTDSNPCAACHNPHAAQGDPANSPNTAKSSLSRGYPVSRPSQHATLTSWGLWGDGAGEKMSDYTTGYQAPYRYNSTTTYEPDGSATQDGSNLTDFNTFCTDCHNATNNIYSTALGRPLKTIDWNNEKHGKGNAKNYITVDPPFTAGSASLGYVLACTDCHEPHGSPNAFLIRNEVNGGVLGGSITSFSNTNWHYLCDRCHQDDQELSASCQDDHYYNIHHTVIDGEDPPFTPFQCGPCHGAGGAGAPSCASDKAKLVCTDCHYHGSIDSGNYRF